MAKLGDIVCFVKAHVSEWAKGLRVEGLARVEVARANPQVVKHGENLRREWHGSRSGERLRQAGEHGQVGVKGDLRQATDAERFQAVLVLEPSELALDCGAARVDVAEAASLARDQRVAPLGLDPLLRFVVTEAQAGRGLTSVRGSGVGAGRSRIYAALAPFGGRGDVDEVDLDDPIEPDGVLDGASGDSVCAPSATVIQVVERHIRG